MVFDKTLMDTQKSVLHFDGEAVLKTQELRSKITADTKQFDLLDLHSPVLIEGKIRSPSISLGRKIPIPTPDFGGIAAIEQALQYGMFDLGRLEALILKQVAGDFFALDTGEDGDA